MNSQISPIENLAPKEQISSKNLQGIQMVTGTWKQLNPIINNIWIDE
jgi:hypothetical protein